jgi:tRNA dimethylallyltransferase
MKTFRQLALIGPTASGKTALSIDAAKKLNAHILSLDSLSLYKEIDIASAKPSLEERGDIKHFGVDMLYPNEPFDVSTFIRLYHEVVANCLQEEKNLVIVGGTSFYLKMLIEGISRLPKIDEHTKQQAKLMLHDIQKSYVLLYRLDAEYMSRIEPTDSYRIEKALLIYLQTGLSPTEYFKRNPPQPTITEALPIYRIEVDKQCLRERIALRTKLMLENALIDEVCALEKKYTRTPNCMGAIGIKETLGYLDGIYDKTMLVEKITTNTARLAKRQTTFNTSQFKDVIKGSVEELRQKFDALVFD